VPAGLFKKANSRHCQMNASLNALLKQTSRSFYLTLRVLPGAIRPQIGLAYLLARTTDTIADTDLVPLDQRLDALTKLRERILGTRQTPVDFSSFLQYQSNSAERVLLERCEDAIAVLRECLTTDARLIRKVLDTITSGQELDLQRFARWGETPSSPDNKIIALQNDAELDDYTYRVAGCVGKFWTDICIAHLFRLPELEKLGLNFGFEELGVRFGKGLQLVNILRDLPADLRKGRCYLPADKLASIGLTPADLLLPSNEPRLRPLYNSYLDLAKSHLAAGWDYTNNIPGGHMRVRLACAWPILIGVKTIDRLRTGNVLDPVQRIKITRPEVRQVMTRSIMAYFWPSRWRRLFNS